MAKNKNRDRKQQEQQQRQGRGTADRQSEQAQRPSMDGQSHAMRSEDGPAAPATAARKDRQKSFGHN
ncbi:hypothetical protein AB0H03_13155 [Streptomyces sparsogenes]|uniref:hypothetical protein n=1 Tax=Streptomyces sparsogenes TaxID=67365 RepID=UPI0033CDA6F7